jgi:hypothetical protein
VIGDRPLARTEGLLTEDVDGEVLVYDQDREIVCRLNGSAALVWRSCNGERTVDEIATTVAEELGEFVDEDLVLVALDNLVAHGLLLSGYEPRAAAAARLSRRRFIGRVGVAGAAAAAIPVVHTMVVPTPASAASTQGYPYPYNQPADRLLRKVKKT